MVSADSTTIITHAHTFHSSPLFMFISNYLVHFFLRYRVWVFLVQKVVLCFYFVIPENHIFWGTYSLPGPDELTLINVILLI